MLRQREREAIERRSQHRYRSLLDSMPQCVWAASSEGEIYYWNRASLAYCGVIADQITRDSFWRVIHPDERPLVEDDWEATIERAAGRFSASCGCGAPATARIAGTSGAWCRSATSRAAVVGWIATAVDIDDHKRAEEELQRAVVHRDDFLSVASHELRTPLTSLKLEVANLERLAQRNQGVVPAPRLRREAGQDRGPGRAPAPADQRAARRVAHRRRGAWSWRSRTSICRSWRTRSARASRTRRRAPVATLTVDAPAPVVGRWDRSRLEQVITNMVTNALKYGQGKPVEVDRRGAATESQARLAVRDQGVGHRARRSAADLRSLRARVVDAQLRRHRPGPVDRARDRARARRRGPRRERARRRRDVHRRAAVRRRILKRRSDQRARRQPLRPRSERSRSRRARRSPAPPVAVVAAKIPTWAPTQRPARAVNSSRASIRSPARRRHIRRCSGRHRQT